MILLRQIEMFAGIYRCVVDSRPEDGRRDSAGVERGSMGDAVDPERQPAHDRESGAHQIAGEIFRHPPAIFREFARPDDGDRFVGKNTSVAADIQEPAAPKRFL